MIYVGTNYVRTPAKAKELTREELITESNRLERLGEIYSERDYEISNDYFSQAKVLDKVLLDHMVKDDMIKDIA